MTTGATGESPAALDVVGPDPTRSYSLPARYYTDADIFEQEKEKIFFRTWQYVCHASRVANPGDYATHQVVDQNIVVLRGKDERLRAFYNVCRHRGHELLEDSGNVRLITCPYHAWTYDTQGQLRGARGAEKGPAFDRSMFCLKTVQVEEFCSLVFVNLDPEAASLRSQSADLEADIGNYVPDLDRLRLARTLTYDIETNWKNVVDNFLECYHCPVSGDGHRAFIDLIDMDTWKTTNHEMYVTSMGRARPDSKGAYAIDDAEVLEHAMWWVWPNTLLLRYPGDPNFMVWNQLPLGIGQTRQIFDFYFLSETPTNAQEEEIHYIDKILQPEDISIMESVQRGQHSRGYDQGWYVIDEDCSAMSEHAVHHFHRKLVGALSN